MPNPLCGPCPSVLKLNCDGAFFERILIGSAAFIVRNTIGALVDGRAFSLYFLF